MLVAASSAGRTGVFYKLFTEVVSLKTPHLEQFFNNVFEIPPPQKKTLYPVEEKSNLYMWKFLWIGVKSILAQVALPWPKIGGFLLF